MFEMDTDQKKTGLLQGFFLAAAPFDVSREISWKRWKLLSLYAIITPLFYSFKLEKH
ncbi:MAG: hypothetical protein ACLVJ7_12540 [Acutalibacteraceae bacterium]